MDIIEDCDSKNSASWVFVDTKTIGEQNNESCHSDCAPDHIQELSELDLCKVKSELDSESDGISVITDSDEDYKENDLLKVDQPQTVNNEHEFAKIAKQQMQVVALQSNANNSFIFNWLIAICFLILTILIAHYSHGDVQTELKINPAKENTNIIQTHSEAKSGIHMKLPYTDDKANKNINSEGILMVSESSTNDEYELVTKKKYRKQQLNTAGTKPDKSKEVIKEKMKHYKEQKKIMPIHEIILKTNHINKESELTSNDKDDLTLKERIPNNVLEDNEKKLKLQEEYLIKKEKILLLKEYNLLQKEMDLNERLQNEDKRASFEENQSKSKEKKYKRKHHKPTKMRKFTKLNNNDKTNGLNNKTDKLLSGEWHGNLHDSRNKMRKFKRESDWLFDRAQYRNKRRNTALWYFRWMNEREDLRMKKMYRHSKQN